MKERRVLGLLLACLLVFSLSACGGARADEALVGHYIPVVGEMWGVSLTGDDLDGFAFDLQSGGKGTVTVDGDASSIRWQNDDAKITVTVGKETVEGTLGTDTFKVEDMLGMGIDLTFAKEGTDAAKPDRYLPEEYQFMIGSWQSTDVTDVLGDPVDEDPYALFMTFSADRTVEVMFEGKSLGLYPWSMVGDWGSLDGDDVPDISWNILDDGLEVNYMIDDEYYVFSCPKGGSIPDSAFETAPSDGGADNASYWDGEWYGWWMMSNTTEEYEELDGSYWDVCGVITVDEDDSSVGYIYLWDEDGDIDDPFLYCDVSFGEGVTDAGCMTSENGFLYDADIGHADWIVDPGASDVSEFDHMIEIDGTYEYESGSFDYSIFLRPWGMEWEDVREMYGDELLPYYYDSWYATVMDESMPYSIATD